MAVILRVCCPSAAVSCRPGSARDTSCSNKQATDPWHDHARGWVDDRHRLCRRASAGRARGVSAGPFELRRRVGARFSLRTTAFAVPHELYAERYMVGHSYRLEGVNGKPRYAAIYHDASGMRRSAGTFATKREADRARASAEADALLGHARDPRRGKITFTAYVTGVWLPNYQSNTPPGSATAT